MQLKCLGTNRPRAMRERVKRKCFIIFTYEMLLLVYMATLNSVFVGVKLQNSVGIIIISS